MIVLLSGQQGAGKTTLAHALKEAAVLRFGYKCAMVYNYAMVLYQMHDAVLDILSQYRPVPKKDGNLLQVLGTEWGRKTIDNNLWVDITKHNVGVFMTNEKAFAIIGDARFENEFDAFPEALRVRLVASEEARKKRCSMWRENTQHPSEIGLNRYYEEGKFDLVLDTESLNVDSCVELIFAQIQKNVWLEKRK